MRTRRSGIAAVVVSLSAIAAGHVILQRAADAAPNKLLIPGKRGDNPDGGTTTPPGGAAPDTSAPLPASVSAATVLVNGGHDLNQASSNDLAAARALFRSASYPESEAGLSGSTELLAGIAASAIRIFDGDMGATLDASGQIALPERLRAALSAAKQHGYSPHLVVGRQQPPHLARPGSQWRKGDWNAYQQYAYQFVRSVAVQFEQSGFPEVLFEVGHEIATVANPLELWTLADPAVPAGDEARYQHYLRLYEVWSRAVGKVARDYPGRTVRIGGPAMGGQSLQLTNSFWHERFVRDVAAAGLRMDTVTYHFYGDIVNGWPDAADSGLKAQLLRVRQALQAAGRGHVPIAITEYGPNENSDAVFGRINYSHTGAAWAAMFIGEALSGSASLGSYALVRDDFGIQSAGSAGVASLAHAHAGVGYPKPVYNAWRMYSLLPGTRKSVTTAASQPDVRAFASADGASAGLIAYNYNFRYVWPAEAADLTVAQSVTPGFYNLPFRGAVAVERYLIDANTSNVARYIDAQQTPDMSGSALTRVEHCAATVDEAGALVLPARVLAPSAVSLWLVKTGGAAGLPACSTQSPDSSGGTTTPSTGDTTTPSTGDTTSPTTGDAPPSSGGGTSAPPPGGTTPPSSGGTDPGSGSTGGTQDFAARCAAAGVVRCVGFDSATDIAGGSGSNTGIGAGAQTAPQIDTTLSASGGGSLKFTIPSNSGSDSSGAYFANFSPDLSVQFGENSDFYVQWRQRFSPEFVSTFYQGSGGIKQAIITTGDQPNRLFASCEAIGVVVQTYYLNRFPIMYNSCTGSASHGPYDGFYERIPYDFKLQNARPSPYCLYTQDPNFFPPNGNCYGWVANEWMTFQVRIQTGPLVNGEWTNSYVTLWAAREGQPSEMVIHWGPYNLTAGAVADNQRFGKVWLLPYQTGKDPAQAHPTAYTWYDELIISRNRIADPAAGSSTPAPQPAGDTAAPSTPPALTAAPASTSEIALSWSASTDAVGVAGYRLERCTGAGCSTFARVASPSGTSHTDTGLESATSYTYRVAALDAAGNVSGYSPTATAITHAPPVSNPDATPRGTPNAYFSDLAPNTAKPLPDLACTDVAGEYAGKCKEVTGYSGMVYDRNRSRMVLFGAGHGGSNYDGIPTLDMNTLTWSEEYQPTACSSMKLANYSFDLGAWLSGTSGPYPRPAARHTLDEMVVLGDELIVLARVEGNAPCVETTGAYTSYELESPAKVAHYDLANKKWSFAATRGALNYAASEYDPVSRKIILLGDWGLEVYDPVTRTKTKAIDFGWVVAVKDELGNDVSSAELGINRSMIYYPPNQKLYYFGASHVFEITLDRSDFSKSRIVKLTTANTPPSLGMDIGGGFAYDSVNQIIGGSVYENRFSAFDPRTKSWTTRTMQGGTPGSTSWHTISYDEVNNVFVFVTMDKKTWAYRYGTGM